MIVPLSLPQVYYNRVAVEEVVVVVAALRCVACAPCAHARTPSPGARAACVPLARTLAPPCLLSRSRSTAHATRAQLLQPGFHSSTRNRARNPNMSMY